jgi:hypothetical protein
LVTGDDGPLSWSGSFGTVFKAKTPSGRTIAVRVFHPGAKPDTVDELQYRYEHLQAFFTKTGASNKLPSEILPVAFVRQGLKIDGYDVPLMKTPWVEGRELHEWVGRRLEQNRPEALEAMAGNWQTLLRDLKKIGVAHGDLHHRNVKVEPDGAMRLIDYDSMFIPEFRGRFNSEVGHFNFQHPDFHFDSQGNMRASARPFDEKMDNFSSIVVYLSLLAVSKQPSLWGKYHNENNLIFDGHRDFLSPDSSPVFADLMNSPSPRVRALAAKLAAYAKGPASAVPSLDEAVGTPSAPSAPVLHDWWNAGAPAGAKPAPPAQNAAAAAPAQNAATPAWWKP